MQAQLLLWVRTVRQDRHGTVGKLLLHVALQRRARRLCLHASCLSAVAYYAVVVDVDVSHLARVATLAETHLAVDNDAYAETPAHVHEHHVALSLAAAFVPLAEGHAARVVVDAGVDVQGVGERFCQRLVEAGEIVVGLALVWVDASAHGHARLYDVAALNARLLDKLVYDGDEGFETLEVVDVVVWYLIVAAHDVAAEVGKREVQTVVSGVDAEKIACLGYEVVDTRCSARVVVAFACFVHHLG